MYPKRKYHPAGGSITVDNIHHEKAMGPEWMDRPPEPVEADPDESDPVAADPDEAAPDGAEPMPTARARNRKK